MRNVRTTIIRVVVGILVAGGAGAGGDLRSTEIYDPATGLFAGAGSRSPPVSGISQFSFRTTTSYSSSVAWRRTPAVTTAELYVPWQETFIAANAPAAARTWTTAAALSFNAGETVRSGPNDGLLLVAGGSANTNASAPTKTAELYGFATVKTDKADYSPGTTVIITGSGFAAGETVALTLLEEPYLDTHPIDPVVADQAGNILSDQFIPDAQDVGIKFYLTATGLTSHSEAQTAFTDANCTSAQSGLWSSPSTWSGCGGSYPQAGNDTATIATGHTVTLDINVTVGAVTINGGVPPGILALGSNTLTVTNNGTAFTLNGTLQSGTGTINYGGTGNQTVAPANYYNLTISGARGNNNNVTLPSGQIGVANALSLTATFTNGGYSVNASITVSFNGTGNQSIPQLPPAYRNLTVNKSSGTATLGGSVTLAGDLSVTAGTLDAGGNTLSRSTNGGTITVGSGATVKLGGLGTTPNNTFSTCTGRTLDVSSTIEYSGAGVRPSRRRKCRAETRRPRRVHDEPELFWHRRYGRQDRVDRNFEQGQHAVLFE